MRTTGLGDHRLVTISDDSTLTRVRSRDRRAVQSIEANGERPFTKRQNQGGVSAAVAHIPNRSNREFIVIRVEIVDCKCQIHAE